MHFYGRVHLRSWNFVLHQRRGIISFVNSVEHALAMTVSAFQMQPGIRLRIVGKRRKNRDQAKKKVGERSEPRGILGRRKGGAVLYPSPGYRWARFACRYFFLFDHVFCLFPPLRSVVPGYSDGSSCNHKKQFVDSWTVNWVRYFQDMMRLIKMYER